MNKKLFIIFFISQILINPAIGIGLGVSPSIVKFKSCENESRTIIIHNPNNYSINIQVHTPLHFMLNQTSAKIPEKSMIRFEMYCKEIPISDYISEMIRFVVQNENSRKQGDYTAGTILIAEYKKSKKIITEENSDEQLKSQKVLKMRFNQREYFKKEIKFTKLIKGLFFSSTIICIGLFLFFVWSKLDPNQ